MTHSMKTVLIITLLWNYYAKQHSVFKRVRMYFFFVLFSIHLNISAQHDYLKLQNVYLISK